MRHDIPVYINVASLNDEEEDIQWDRTHFSATALTCTEVPMLEPIFNPDVSRPMKQFMVCFHKGGQRVNSFRVNVPVRWTPYLFLRLINLEMISSDQTITCVYNIDENDLSISMDILEIVEEFKTYPPEGLMRATISSADISGGDYIHESWD